MDESSAVLVLSRVMPHFIAIVSEEAKTLPTEDGMCACTCMQPVQTPNSLLSIALSPGDVETSEEYWPGFKI
jgi:hypothetical protein